MHPRCSRTLALALLSLRLTGCSTRPESASGVPRPVAFAAPTQLTAAPAEDAHIDLRWESNATEEGGSFLEFTMSAGEDFTLLEIVPQGTLAIRHPDVAPETTYSYRVRPFFGGASDLAVITTGHRSAKAVLIEGEGPLEGNEPARTSQRRSIRTAGTFAQSRPTGLTAALSSPTSVDLRWQDRATDEEGYLVELKTDAEPEFRVCALLPVDATSFRKTRLPPGTRCEFRVRAYFSGNPSNVAAVTTPARFGLAPAGTQPLPDILIRRP